MAIKYPENTSYVSPASDITKNLPSLIRQAQARIAANLAAKSPSSGLPGAPGYVLGDAPMSYPGITLPQRAPGYTLQENISPLAGLDREALIEGIRPYVDTGVQLQAPYLPGTTLGQYESEVGPYGIRDVSGVPYAREGEYLTPEEVTSEAEFKHLPTHLGGGQYLMEPSQPGKGILSERTDDWKKRELLRQGLDPYLYELDHSIPLWAGGSDTPSNMEILTRINHDEKTRLQAVPYTLLSHGLITQQEAVRMAQGWRDRAEHWDINYPEPDSVGMLSLRDAQKIADKWAKKPPVRIKDILASIPAAGETVYKSMGKVADKVLGTDDNPVNRGIRAFTKGFASGLIPGASLAMPQLDAFSGTRTEKGSQVLGAIAGNLLFFGFAYKLALKGLSKAGAKWASKELGKNVTSRASVAKLNQLSVKHGASFTARYGTPSRVTHYEQFGRVITDATKKDIFGRKLGIDAMKGFGMTLVGLAPKAATMGAVSTFMGQVKPRPEGQSRGERAAWDFAFGAVTGHQLARAPYSLKGYASVAAPAFVISSLEGLAPTRSFTEAGAMSILINTGTMVGVHALGHAGTALRSSKSLLVQRGDMAPKTKAKEVEAYWQYGPGSRASDPEAVRTVVALRGKGKGATPADVQKVAQDFSHSYRASTIDIINQDIKSGRLTKQDLSYIFGTTKKPKPLVYVKTSKQSELGEQSEIIYKYLNVRQRKEGWTNEALMREKAKIFYSEREIYKGGLSKTARNRADIEDWTSVSKKFIPDADPDSLSVTARAKNLFSRLPEAEINTPPLRESIIPSKGADKWIKEQVPLIGVNHENLRPVAQRLATGIKEGKVAATPFVGPGGKKDGTQLVNVYVVKDQFVGGGKPEPWGNVYVWTGNRFESVASVPRKSSIVDHNNKYGHRFSDPDINNITFVQEMTDRATDVVKMTARFNPEEGRYWLTGYLNDQVWDIPQNRKLTSIMNPPRTDKTPTEILAPMRAKSTEIKTGVKPTETTPPIGAKETPESFLFGDQAPIYRADTPSGAILSGKKDLGQPAIIPRETVKAEALRPKTDTTAAKKVKVPKKTEAVAKTPTDTKVDSSVKDIAALPAKKTDTKVDSSVKDIAALPAKKTDTKVDSSVKDIAALPAKKTDTKIISRTEVRPEIKGQEKLNRVETEIQKPRGITNVQDESNIVPITGKLSYKQAKGKPAIDRLKEDIGFDMVTESKALVKKHNGNYDKAWAEAQSTILNKYKTAGKDNPFQTDSKSAWRTERSLKANFVTQAQSVDTPILLFGKDSKGLKLTGRIDSSPEYPMTRLTTIKGSKGDIKTPGYRPIKIEFDPKFKQSAGNMSEKDLARQLKKMVDGQDLVLFGSSGNKDSDFFFLRYDPKKAGGKPFNEGKEIFYKQVLKDLSLEDVDAPTLNKRFKELLFNEFRPIDNLPEMRTIYLDFGKTKIDGSDFLINDGGAYSSQWVFDTMAQMGGFPIPKSKFTQNKNAILFRDADGKLNIIKNEMFLVGDSSAEKNILENMVRKVYPDYKYKPGDIIISSENVKTPGKVRDMLGKQAAYIDKISGDSLYAKWESGSRTPNQNSKLSLYLLTKIPGGKEFTSALQNHFKPDIKVYTDFFNDVVIKPYTSTNPSKTALEGLKKHAVFGKSEFADVAYGRTKKVLESGGWNDNTAKEIDTLMSAAFRETILNGMLKASSYSKLRPYLGGYNSERQKILDQIIKHELGHKVLPQKELNGLRSKLKNGKFKSEQLPDNTLLMSEAEWISQGRPEFALVPRHPSTKNSGVVPTKIAIADSHGIKNLGSSVILNQKHIKNDLYGDFDGDAVPLFFKSRAGAGREIKGINEDLYNVFSKQYDNYKHEIPKDLTPYPKGMEPTQSNMEQLAIQSVSGGRNIGQVASTRRIIQGIFDDGGKIYNDKGRVVYEMTIKDKKGFDKAMQLLDYYNNASTDSVKNQDLSRVLSEGGYKNMSQLVANRFFGIDHTKKEVMDSFRKEIYKLQTPFNYALSPASSFAQMMDDFSKYYKQTASRRIGNGKPAPQDVLSKIVHDNSNLMQMPDYQYFSNIPTDRRLLQHARNVIRVSTQKQFLKDNPDKTGGLSIDKTKNVIDFINEAKAIKESAHKEAFPLLGSRRMSDLKPEVKEQVQEIRRKAFIAITDLFNQKKVNLSTGEKNAISLWAMESKDANFSNLGSIYETIPKTIDYQVRLNSIIADNPVFARPYMTADIGMINLAAGQNPMDSKTKGILNNIIGSSSKANTAAAQETAPSIPVKQPAVKQPTVAQESTKSIQERLPSLFKTAKKNDPITEGTLVRHNNILSLVRKINENKKAKLVSPQGKNLPGTPNISNLTPLGRFPTLKINKTNYIVTDKGNVISTASGKYIESPGILSKVIDKYPNLKNLITKK